MGAGVSGYALTERRRLRYGTRGGASSARRTPGRAIKRPAEFGERIRMSTNNILSATAAMVARLHGLERGGVQHLDVGAGSGDLIELLRQKHPRLSSVACDCTDELIRVPDVVVTCVDLNTEALPYREASFDLVTCTEVIEHTENFRSLLRDSYRVLRADGTLVLTTPNVLNLKSRLRYLFFGFFNLFGPLRHRETLRHTCEGHISPVSVYYLVHALRGIGFEQITVGIDKRQGTSAVLLSVLILPIKILSRLFMRRERHRYKTIDGHNETDVELMNGIDIVVGRTIVVGCKKR